MRLRTPTIDLLVAEFAVAVARGDTDAAEGWLATAIAVTARTGQVLPEPVASQ